MWVRWLIYEGTGTHTRLWHLLLDGANDPKLTRCGRRISKYDATEYAEKAPKDVRCKPCARNLESERKARRAAR